MRRGGQKKSVVGEDAAEIPVSYDKRDNGLSNYPVERLNRATMKFVLFDVIFLLFVSETCGGSRGWLNLQ